jgi:preprotein translocase subunit SecD
VLFEYGSGPIRGFAVTLSSGHRNLFTSVGVALMFDSGGRRRSVRVLSI